jgi:radical SAM protein with 4Fe4S-binding SPASM domain
MPKSLKIEITARCNFNCSFCAAKQSLRPIGDINEEFLYDILKRCKEAGVEEVGLFLLGESFLVKDLPKYIRYAKEEVGFEYIFLTTNGSLCTPERLIPVIEAGLDSLKFSINAPTREKYKEIHGVDCFDKVVDHVKWLSQYRREHKVKMKTSVSSIYIEEDKKELKAFEKMISQYVDEFYYLPFYNQGGHIDGEKYKKLIGNPGRLDHLVPVIPCWVLFTGLKITWDGKLTACCFDHESEFEVADLTKVSLEEAWNCEKYAELRRCHLENDFSNSPCSKCLGKKG